LDGAAESALFTGIGRGTLLAVEGFGEQTSSGGFARAARTAEQIGVRPLTLLNGVAQRDGDMRLPHQLIEILRPILAIEADIGHDNNFTLQMIWHVAQQIPPHPQLFLK
jgi:hypothetical protein